MKGKKAGIILVIITIMLLMIAGTVYYRFIYYVKPEKALDEAFDSVIRQDDTTAEQYLDYWQLYGGTQDKELYKLLLKDFSYEIDQIDQKEDTATAVLTVTNRNIEEIYGQFVTEAYQLVLSDAYLNDNEQKSQNELKYEIDALLINKLTSATTAPRKAKITVDMVRHGHSWYIELDESDRNEIYGGYYNALASADQVLGDLSPEALKNLEKTYKIKIDNAKHELKIAAHFIVDTIWNKDLCNIVSCINAGTDTEGNEYDIEAGMVQLKKDIQEKRKYDQYVDDLDTTHYQSIMDAWQEMSQQLDKLVSELDEEDPKPIDFDYIPDTQPFQNALKAFTDLVYPE